MLQPLVSVSLLLQPKLDLLLLSYQLLAWLNQRRMAMEHPCHQLGPRAHLRKYPLKYQQQWLSILLRAEQLQPPQMSSHVHLP